MHTEMATGYPHFKWYVIGQLAEAEAECVADYPEFANTIREYRKEFEADEHVALPYEQLILDATQLDEDADERVDADTVRFTPGVYGASVDAECIHAADRDAAIGLPSTAYLDNVDDFEQELDRVHGAVSAEMAQLAAASRAREEARD